MISFIVFSCHVARNLFYDSLFKLKHPRNTTLSGTLHQERGEREERGEGGGGEVIYSQNFFATSWVAMRMVRMEN